MFIQLLFVFLLLNVVTETVVGLGYFSKPRTLSPSIFASLQRRKACVIVAQWYVGGVRKNAASVPTISVIQHQFHINMQKFTKY
ncbi:hypothetical protein Y032_0038g3601 [Ancylostoma ceylanicum]|uniref:Secreted protein n=1 Tax=Ancylostoma ceylanicum TaxID=53326 RepID=A0A016UI82_9BILA|nr:hypothetical protein Y032_0038g3601 [Ancylostoma ceylanicum]